MDELYNQIVNEVLKLYPKDDPIVEIKLIKTSLSGGGMYGAYVLIDDEPRPNSLFHYGHSIQGAMAGLLEVVKKEHLETVS